MKILYIHGGPGLNSHPESCLLKEQIEARGYEAYFWNEPSFIRGMVDPNEVSFHQSGRSLKKVILNLSADEPIVILAHSFGAFLLNSILPEIQSSVSKLILIAPVSNLFDLDRNIVNAAIKDYEQSSRLEEALELKRLAGLMTETYDVKRFDALLMAARNEKLALNYWKSTEAMTSYYQQVSEPEFQFDLRGFKSVRETCAQVNIANNVYPEAILLYGRLDKIVRLEQELSKIQSTYNNFKLHIFDRSAHYPHVEEMENFLDLCLADESLRSGNDKVIIEKDVTFLI